MKAYGWVMNWKPLKSVDMKKVGEELTIKTIFKKRVGSENVSVYLSNIVVKDMIMIERMKEINGPIPIYIEGVKKGEKIYNNLYMNDIENTKKLVYVFLNRRGLTVRLVNHVPAKVLEKYRAIKPPMTFKKYASVRCQT